MIFNFNLLTREYMKDHVDDFINMNNANLANEYWESSHFLAELNRKWELSFYTCTAEGKMASFLIASDKISVIHIHKYVVDHPFQRQGLGSKMLSHLFGKTDKPISLKVEKKNEKALRFYLRNHFLIKGSQEDLYTMIHER
jgi:ribosomal protein S18 acetylase RimI-like enzyme